MIDAVVTGVTETIGVIGKSKGKVGDVLENIVVKCATVGLKKALIYVPRDTGALAASGHIEKRGKGLAAKADISFGGPDAPYALWVHEDPEKHHDPPTCYKYAERAVRETRGTMASIAKREVTAHKGLTKDGAEAPAFLD